MPAWLAPILIKAGEAGLSLAMQYVFPKLLAWLRASGHINAAEELAAKGAVAVAQEMKTIKTYPEYPTGVNGASSGDPVS